MGSIVLSHLAPGGMEEGLENNPPNKNRIGAKIPTTACAVSKDGIDAATACPKLTSTSASAYVAR